VKKSAYIPAIEEIRFDEFEKSLSVKANEEILSLIEQMPTRLARLAVIWLGKVKGREPFVQMCKDAKYKVGDNSKVSAIKKRLAGKLGPVLFEIGITELDLIEVLSDSLHANIAHVYFNKDTGVARIVETPDHATRLRTVDKLLSLGSYFPASKLDVRGQITHDIGSIQKSLEDLKRRELDMLEKSKEIPGQFEVVENAG